MFANPLEVDIVRDLFFINGKLHDVSYGIQALAEGVEAALKR